MIIKKYRKNSSLGEVRGEVVLYDNLASDALKPRVVSKYAEVDVSLPLMDKLLVLSENPKQSIQFNFGLHC